MTGVSVIRHRRLAAAVVAAFCLAAGPARAQVTCGATVGPRGTTTLTADLGPCDGGDVAVFVDSATLDLGGHTVSCADTDGDGDVPDGIGLVGRRARVQNGTVVGCRHGVVAAGKGKHSVEGISTTTNSEDGIHVVSNKNRLSGNTAIGNGDEGFEVIANKNTLAGNTAIGNRTQGIDIDGRKNRITANTATGNVGGPDAVDSAGSPGCRRNKWRGNTFGTRSPSCIQ